MTGMLRTSLLAIALGASLAVPAGAAVTGYKEGKGGSPVSGAAGTDGAKGDAGLEKCDKPMGAMAVVEPQDFVMQSLGRYGLGSPVGLIRMMIQQSNCFIVVERGVGMQNMMQERDLAASGEARKGANMGKGQMVAADFILTPSVVFSEDDAGGVGGALGGFLARKNPLFGVVAGGLKYKEAQTSMLVADARSGVQVAAAEGSTRKADLKLGAGFFGGGLGGAVGGYGNTNEGKLIASAFLDNYRQIVSVVRNDPSLQRDVGTLKQEAAAGGQAGKGPVYNEGDVVTPKINGVKLLAGSNDAAKVVVTLSKGDELVVLGGEENGYLHVQGSAGSGWVKKILVAMP
jgi:curli biogenesis system outer membrane secretion channel CsgG